MILQAGKLAISHWFSIQGEQRIVAAYGISVLNWKRTLIFGLYKIIYLSIVSRCTLYNPCDLCGPIAQVQNSENLRPLIDELREADSFAIMSADVVWPYMWYLAKYGNKMDYFTGSIPKASAIKKRI